MSETPRKVKNPLLNAAGIGFPFDNFTENNILMPVTPATPAILPDVPKSEVGKFIGEEQPRIPSAQVDASASDVGGNANSQAAPSQGYFTSILSSIPNLSLPSAKVEPPAVQNPPVTHYPQSSGVYPHLSQPSLASNPYEIDPALRRPPLQKPPQSIAPPSGSAPSTYRLGNQRRLKYAPLPDLATNTTKQYPAVPPVQPLVQEQAYSQSNFLVPNYAQPASQQQPFSRDGLAGSFAQQSLPPEKPLNVGPPLSTTDVSRGLVTPPNAQSIDKPVNTRPPPLPSDPSISFTPANVKLPEKPQIIGPPSSVGLTSTTSVIPSTIPTAIPQRILEPATPQNTPATSAFAAFGGPPTSNSFLDFKREAHDTFNNWPDTVNKEATANPESADKAFTPLSAARVSEKLENLIAEQRSNDGPSQPEASSAGNDDDGLAEIDLKANDSVPQLFSTSELIVTNSKASFEDDIAKAPNLIGFFDSTSPVSSHKSPEVRDNSSVKLSSGNFEINKQDTNKFSNFNLNPIVQVPPKSQSSTIFPPAAVHPVADQSSIAAAPKSVEQTFNLYPAVNVKSTPPLANTYQAFNLNPATSVQQQTYQNYNLNPIGGNPATSAQTYHQTPVSQSFELTQQQDNVTSAPTFYNPNQFTSAVFHQPSESVASGGSHLSSFFPSDEHKVAPPQHVFGPTTGFRAPEPSGTAVLNPVQISVNPMTNKSSPNTIPPSLENLAHNYTERRVQYRPVYHHWFYREEIETKVVWKPMSMSDSLKLEDVHSSNDISADTMVATEGGRYDVEILRRQRSPVYWSGPPNEVRRCSWFYKGVMDSRCVPYDESVALKLEEEYKQAYVNDSWNRRVELSNGEFVIFHSPTVQMHYLQSSPPEIAATWGAATGVGSRPRVVKRGLDEFTIDDGEPDRVDHLLFLVHGIGSVCDLKFRSVEEVVQEFRSISLQLVQSHYRSASEQGVVNRIEVLPISWHTTLHSEDTGIDKKLKAITLESIPKLRHFTNDTLLDILFYTSPVYCQTIMHAVGNEINRLFALFKDRNPNFDGDVYLGGHSLGSLILFDLLCHQKPTEKPVQEEEIDPYAEKSNDEDSLGPIKPLPAPVLKRRLSKRVSYVMGAAGTGQPFIKYPQLAFNPSAFFAMGSPIGMFVTVRGIDTLGEDFALPTCPAFFNIFHPFDPVAYRVEALVTPDAANYRPSLIPHHKGRKRMHLELKETMARVGADLKQRLLDSMRNTWNSVYQLAMFHKADNQSLEREIDKVVEEQMQQSPSPVADNQSDEASEDFKVGKLNRGRRIDYVLQEAPFEYINEYIVAVTTSHVCYWESEDTMLLILKEIYGTRGIHTDAQSPQLHQSMTIERPFPSTSPSSSIHSDISSSAMQIGMDPTAPISNKVPIGPPPMAGFVRKS